MNHLNGLHVVIIRDFFFTHATLANRAGVLPLEPSRHTLRVIAMEALQDYVLLPDLVLALADCTLFVLFAEVLEVGCREF